MIIYDPETDTIKDYRDNTVYHKKVFNGHHTSPSNAAWVQFKTESTLHYVRREWDEPPTDSVRMPIFSTDQRRSDGMLWNVYKNRAECGLYTPSLGRIVDVFIGANKDQCCHACWVRKW